ncbi:MAG: gamma-butyrobetaine hydroxylase-like domain-containing protein [Alphaproteobacteria bacterium]
MKGDQKHKIKSIVYSKNNKNINIEFCDNYTSIISAELLRVESPSAEVQGHGPKEKKTILNKNSVSITNIEKVGNYAIRIIFDDGHDTGIYSWSYLRKIAENNCELYKDYLKRVSKIIKI